MKKLTFLLLLCFVLVGCNKSTEFKLKVYAINDGVLVTECSEQVNEGKTGGINGIGYSCNILINDDTILLDEAGNIIELEQFSEGDTVIVHPVKKKRISEKNLQFDASSIQISYELN